VQKVRLYDETAPIYHRRYRLIQKVKYQAVTPFLRVGPLVDVGIGTGIGVPALIDFSPVIGVDGAIEMLRFAVEQLKVVKQKNQLVSFVCALAEALPFRDSSVPTVVSITTIQNVTDIHKGLRELVRILQEDGILAVTSLAKILPLDTLKASIDGKYSLITQFRDLAGEDDGLVFQLA
jgi:ubiquinone/menaquinone biosynthesis C-methylase UbiE